MLQFGKCKSTKSLMKKNLIRYSCTTHEVWALCFMSGQSKKCVFHMLHINMGSGLIWYINANIIHWLLQNVLYFNGFESAVNEQIKLSPPSPRLIKCIWYPRIPDGINVNIAGGSLLHQLRKQWFINIRRILIRYFNSNHKTYSRGPITTVTTSFFPIRTNDWSSNQTHMPKMY